jgi:uncharacterized protein YkwD
MTTYLSKFLLAIVAFLAVVPWQPAYADPDAVAGQMVEDINSVRAQAGLPPMTEDVTLQDLATERSLDMAERRYFSHTTPEGGDVFAMMALRGVEFRTAGENLAWNSNPEPEAAQAALRGLLDSPPHRANLLNPEFRQLGVGVATMDGKHYFTLVFIG